MSQPPSHQGEPYPGQPDPNQPPGQPPAQPYPGQPPAQPYPGQADPNQQYAGHQGYPPPSFPPPAFPPPGGHPGYPGTFSPPAKKSNVLKIVLISLAIVLVLCIGGIVAAVFVVKDEVASVVDAQKITVVEPVTLGGRPKLTDPKFASATAGLKAELAKAPGTTSTVGALYGDPAKRDIVMIAGASAPLLDPSKQLDDTLNGTGAGGLSLSELSPVDPGPLGGTAKCGNGTTAGVDLALCAWADNGSIGIIAAYFKTADQLKVDFVALRGQVEQKTG